MLPYGLLGLFGCGLLSLVADRVAADGVAGLHHNGQDLRPALLFFAVVATGTVIAAHSVQRQLTATRELAADVRTRSAPLPASVAEAAARSGLAGRVDVIRDAVPYSFTYGVWKPRVAVSLGLIDAVDAGELAAVLQHERYHVRNADTIKVIVARAAPAAFFFLPALRHLRDRYLAGRELAADRAAVRATGERAVAGALSGVLQGPTWVDLGAAAALGGGLLEHRIQQLEEGVEPRLPPVPGTARWATAAGLAALVAAFVLAVAVASPDMLSMDGSMPRGGVGMALTMLSSTACTVAMVAVAAAALGATRDRAD